MNTDILAISLSIIAVICLFWLRQQGAKSVGKEYYYGIIGLFLLLALVGVLIDYYTTAAAPVASSVWPANIVSGATYLNANASALFVYATTQGYATAYIGANTAALTEVANASATYTGTGAITYNVPKTVVIPANWFYRFNYTLTQFKAEYTNST